MAYSSAEKKAHRTVIIWATISLIALMTEATALLLISLSTESVDCSELTAEYERRLAQTNRQTAHHQAAGEMVQGKSLEHLINLIISCTEGISVRITELAYQSGSCTIKLEAQTAEDLDTAIRTILMHNQIEKASLTERTAQSATLGISSWAS